MKVLHIYPKSDVLIQQHVTMLMEGMRQSAEVSMADSSSNIRKLITEQQPDILHLHGCWNQKLTRAAHSAIKKGSRLVITLHGQLEPWNIAEQSIQDKVANGLLWQKDVIGKAHAVLTMGKLELTNFQKLEWNKRVEEIHNAVTTNTITPAEMCTETFSVYQKVMDSNTLEQMDDLSQQALSTIIKASIMGDRRWCAHLSNFSYPEDIDWRRLLIYAEHENIRNYVDYGISILGWSVPSIDTERIGAYFPDSYARPLPFKEIIGNYEGDETEYLMRMIRHLSKQPLLLHLIELTRELYRDTINDEMLTSALEEKRLTAFAACLMQILSEQTELDEGYMPLPAVDNRQTRHFRKFIMNHLKI